CVFLYASLFLVFVILCRGKFLSLLQESDGTGSNGSEFGGWMENIWHPLEGVQILDLGEKRFLFKFFNKLDINQVQIHDLPPGFFKDSMVVQFGNFIEKYLEYDMKQLSNDYKNYLCIRVQIDTRFGQQSGQNSRQNQEKGSWANINPILRINLEGTKFTDVLNGLHQRQESRHNARKDLVTSESQQLGTSL
ncbi:hypothetical protein Gorai_004714, partial [Gossypium raimondii]|nr:hypothetical protein [Gossypium raimondii]